MEKSRSRGPASSPDDFIKRSGSVYTPEFLVRSILDVAGYADTVLKMHVIDNSCGDGAFLTEVVRRYCQCFVELNAGGSSELAEQLSTYIHGVELNSEAIAICKERLDSVAAVYGATNVTWDLRLGNSLNVDGFRGRMDFVVGNPPYVRIHNLGESAQFVRSLTFARDGMTDLYLAFFDIGLQMLNARGRLCLITPSSWLTSKAARAFRQYIRSRRALAEVVDLGHYQPFNATTYTMITLLDRRTQHQEVTYFRYDPTNQTRIKQHILGYDQCFMESGLYFAEGSILDGIRPILTYASTGQDTVTVKMGFQTSADDVFIGDHRFTAGTIPVVKASTGSVRRCVYPYNADGGPMSEADFERIAPEAMRHLRTNRHTLQKRSLDPSAQWYLFGRSQALRDVSQLKYAVNSLIRTHDQIRLVEAPPGTGVYGGLYIKTEASLPDVEACLRDRAFLTYVQNLRKYKNGGYYTYEASDLSRFLNCQLTGRQ